MKTVFSLTSLKKYKRPVLALGVFDGVHLGHINILKSVVKKAHVARGTSMVLTFSPHPQKEESLCSLEHRLKLINELGIDVAIVINFDKRFASIRAADFIKNIVIKLIRPHLICIGRNFRFGKNAEGSCKMLEEFSKGYNYKLKVFSVVKRHNRPISSTLIRALIKKGDLTHAERLLGRQVSVLGTIIKGRSLGRKLGFSTANIDAHHEVVPAKGVYAVNIILGARKFNGVCYIGTKPTLGLKNVTVQRSEVNQGVIPAPVFTGVNSSGNPKRVDRMDARFHGHDKNGRRELPEAELLLKNRVYPVMSLKDNEVHIETHIFNFNKYIYGNSLEIRFIKKIREERKFSSFFALSEQIKKDITFAKRIISRR
ncbi:MAG: bifunctional riboflavin kinase/FMN adenylyltransferase [Candidatus Omnitrophota bacterium]|nr:bifunctional riboflavin kinase/FMN adenylyltransferase [Candidatus Omnitrophota bacterium]